MSMNECSAILAIMAYWSRYSPKMALDSQEHMTMNHSTYTPDPECECGHLLSDHDEEESDIELQTIGQTSGIVRRIMPCHRCECQYFYDTAWNDYIPL